MSLLKGRLKHNKDTKIKEFLSSLEMDRELIEYDIKGSIAHVEMLAQCKIISVSDSEKITRALRDILQNIHKGNIKLPKEEDIHLAVEKLLIRKVGKVGEKIHTARSRNDQVVLDERLYLKDKIPKIISLLKVIQSKILIMVRKSKNAIFPGFTHLQHAQPVFFSDWLLAYNEMLKRDIERFKGCLRRVDVSPLGACALAGTTLPISVKLSSKKLGFKKIFKNSIDAVSDRDFLLEFLFCSSVLVTHLSRIMEDLIIFSTEEFGFIEFSEDVCSTSSVMPQKKNPDVAELIRGKTGKVYGSLFSLLVILKGLPLSYNRDMQEDKEPLLLTTRNLEKILDAVIKVFSSFKINKKKMRSACEKGYMNATELANYLVTKGLPFRNAHSLVGKIVRYCIDKGKKLNELSLDEYKKFSKLFSEDLYKKIDIDNIVKRASH